MSKYFGSCCATIVMLFPAHCTDKRLLVGRWLHEDNRFLFAALALALCLLLTAPSALGFGEGDTAKSGGRAANLKNETVYACEQ